jgi:hypothetical protein
MPAASRVLRIEAWIDLVAVEVLGHVAVGGSDRLLSVIERTER